MQAPAQQRKLFLCVSIMLSPREEDGNFTFPSVNKKTQVRQAAQEELFHLQEILDKLTTTVHLYKIPSRAFSKIKCKH
jgi:hypothetical protein